MPISPFPLSAGAQKEADALLRSLHKDPAFWKANSGFLEEAKIAVSFMSEKDFQILLEKTKTEKWGTRSTNVVNYLSTKHHNLDPEAAEETLVSQRSAAYDEKTKTLGLRFWLCGAAATAIIPSMAAIGLANLITVPGLPHIVIAGAVAIAAAGTTLAATTQLASNGWSKLCAVGKPYFAQNWSSWKIGTAGLNDAHIAQMKDPRFRAGLECRFAELSEQERWLSKSLSNSQKIDFLLATEPDVRAVIVERDERSLANEIGALVAADYEKMSIAGLFDTSKGSLSTLRGVARIANAHVLAKYSATAAQKKDMDFAECFHPLAADHFTPQSLLSRIEDRRKKIQEIVGETFVYPANSATRDGVGVNSKAILMKSSWGTKI